MADVTVIIPSKNRRAMLARTLHSVLAQQDVSLRVVVVDDGGSDGTPAAVASLGDPRVTVIRHERSRGVSAARNTGIEASDSPWLAFVDDDDLWSPRKVRVQLDALAADSDARWSCTGAVRIDEQSQIIGGNRPPEVSDVADLLLSANHVPGGGSGSLAARDLVLSVGGFDRNLSNLADWDFYVRLGLAAPLAGVQEYHVGYFIHSQGMAHNVARSSHEYEYMRVKYDQERHSRGVRLEEAEWMLYLAWMARRSGDHAKAMALYAAVLRRYPTRGNAALVARLSVPMRLRKAPALRWMLRRADDDLAWADDAPAWLAPYTHGWLEPEIVKAGGRYPASP